MLVHLKEDMAYTQLDQYRIYGMKFAYGSFGDTDIPWELYREHANILEEGFYTSDWLKNKYGRDFPSVIFKISEMRKLDFDTIIEIAKGLCINFITSSRTTYTQQKSLRIRVHKILKE